MKTALKVLFAFLVVALIVPLLLNVALGNQVLTHPLRDLFERVDEVPTFDFYSNYVVAKGIFDAAINQDLLDNIPIIGLITGGVNTVLAAIYAVAQIIVSGVKLVASFITVIFDFPRVPIPPIV